MKHLLVAAALLAASSAGAADVKPAVVYDLGGFIGGTDVPLIRRFACGYVLDARHARPDIQRDALRRARLGCRRRCHGCVNRAPAVDTATKPLMEERQ